ncbi:hypothetical protein LXL04_034930 [Taraxacum kok-saghyz]
MQSESPNNSPRTAVPPKSQLRSATARSDMKKSQQLVVKSSEPETAEILSIGQMKRNSERQSNSSLWEYGTSHRLGKVGDGIRICSNGCFELLQGLDGEATEPMIKELDEDREESQDPEVEFAIAGAVREWKFCWKLFRCVNVHLVSQKYRIGPCIVQNFRVGTEMLAVFQKWFLQMYKNGPSFARRFKVKPGAVSRCSAAKYEETEPPYLNSGGALSLLLAFSVEPSEGILLIVESLTMEANESDNINITQNALTHFDGGRIRLFTSVEA